MQEVTEQEETHFKCYTTTLVECLNSATNLMTTHNSAGSMHVSSADT
jgi:hypothetical protein